MNSLIITFFWGLATLMGNASGFHVQDWAKLILNGQNFKTEEVGWDYSSGSKERIKVAAVDGSDEDFYGHSLSMCDAHIVVGSYSDSYRGRKSGSAYIYNVKDRNSWDLQSKIFPSRGRDLDYFGWSVSCYKNFTVIGAYGSDIAGKDVGAVYVYSEDNKSNRWDEYDILLPFNGQPGDYFGWNVAMHGDVILVGSIGKDWSGIDSGLVYAYTKATPEETVSNLAKLESAENHTIPNCIYWVLESVISPADSSPYSYFGWSLSIFKETVVVGAPWKDLKRGSAYLFKRNHTVVSVQSDDQYLTYQETSYHMTAPLLPHDRHYRDFYGSSLAQSETVVVVGAHMALGEDEMTHAGAVYVYKLKGQEWYLQEKLTPFLYADQITYFGYSVAVDGNTLLVGAPGSTDSSNSSVHIYNENSKSRGWDLIAMETSPDIRTTFTKSDPGFGYGVSVSIHEGTAVVGSEKGSGLHSSESGCIYVYFARPMYPTLASYIFSRMQLLEIMVMLLMSIGLIVLAVYVRLHSRLSKDELYNPYDGLLDYSDDAYEPTAVDVSSTLSSFPASIRRSRFPPGARGVDRGSFDGWAENNGEEGSNVFRNQVANKDFQSRAEIDLIRMSDRSYSRDRTTSQSSWLSMLWQPQIPGKKHAPLSERMRELELKRKVDISLIAEHESLEKLNSKEAFIRRGSGLVVR